jgi:glycosyltransferase involved in cell wall biosynthesis
MTKNLRAVALMSPGWPPSRVPNGIVTYTAAMREAFRAVGVRTHILVPDLDGESEPGVLPLFDSRLVARAMRAASRLGWMWARPAEGAIEEALITRTRWLRRAAAVGVLEMEESHGWVGPVARRVAVPVVARLHGPWFLNGRALGVSLDDAFDARVAKEREGILAAAAVSAPSYDVLRQTRAYYGVPLHSAAVIPYPVAAVPAERVWSLQRCERGTVLFIGRFDRHKGGDLVIDAFASLAAENPELRLLFAGPDRGLVDDAGRWWDIRGYLRRVPGAVRDRVSLLGPQSRARLMALRRQGAVLVVPSRYENFPYSALEGMAQGCPMVVARVGGLPEMIQHERNGLLFAPGDARDLAGQIERLLGDSVLSARLGSQAKSDALARYAPPLIAHRTLNLYRSLV